NRNGDTFVADLQNHAIRRISPTRAVTTIAGGLGWGTADGIGSAAHFMYPTAIAVSGSGNVYVADCANTVRKLSPVTGQTGWQVTTLAGSGFATGSTDGSGTDARFGAPIPAGSTGPVGRGNLYPASNFQFLFPGNNSYWFADMVGLAVDAAENVYVSDGG